MSITQEQFDTLFPSERTNEFFEALFGDADEGAYNIRIEPNTESETRVDCMFALHQRPGKCLVCQLTHGLPHVFERHPLINAAGLAKEIAILKGWDPESVKWTIGETIQHSRALLTIPFAVFKA
jgi:hypothetical protein